LKSIVFFWNSVFAESVKLFDVFSSFPRSGVPKSCEVSNFLTAGQKLASVYSHSMREMHLILERLVSEPLPSILKEYNIQPVEFFRVLRSSEFWDKKYQSILQDKADFLAEEITHIADVETDPARARNRIQARQWYASKLQPVKYGDRVNVAVDRVDLSGALTEARSRVLHPCFTPQLPAKQVIDVIGIPDVDAPDKQSVACLDDLL